MGDISLTDREVAAFRNLFGVLTESDKEHILSLVGDVRSLDQTLEDIAAQHGTTKGVVLLCARDQEGRNAVHHAAMRRDADMLGYLISPGLFPHQPVLRLALLDCQTNSGENTAFYAIRHRCPPSFLDSILLVTGPALLRQRPRSGLGALHHAALHDAGELIVYLVRHHGLDPHEALDGDNTLHDGAVDGDTPAHLAARHDCAGAFEALHGELQADCSAARNAAGETAFDVVTSAGAERVIAYLDGHARQFAAEYAGGEQAAIEMERPSEDGRTDGEDDDAPLSLLDESAFDSYPSATDEEDQMEMFGGGEDMPAPGRTGGGSGGQKRWRRKKCRRRYE